MNKARLSLFVFGLYMLFVVGLGFMLMPMFILNLFGLSAGDDVWIRFVGMLAAMGPAYYCLQRLTLPVQHGLCSQFDRLSSRVAPSELSPYRTMRLSNCVSTS